MRLYGLIGGCEHRSRFEVPWFNRMSDLKAPTYKKLSASLKLKTGPVLEGPNHLDVRDPRILKNRPMWGKA